MNYRDRLEEAELCLYGLSRPDCRRTAAAVRVTDSAAELFRSGAAAAVRMGTVHIRAEAEQDCVLEVGIRTQDGEEAGLAGRFEIKAGTGSCVYPFYVRGGRTVTVYVTAVSGEAYIAPGNASIAVFGGREG